MNEQDAAEAAAHILEKHKIRDPRLFVELTEALKLEERVPLVRFYWDSKAERLKVEIVS